MNEGRKRGRKGMEGKEGRKTGGMNRYLIEEGQVRSTGN